MRRIIFTCLCLPLFLSFNPLSGNSVDPTHTPENISRESIEVIAFNSPKGWHYADKSALPPSVKVMVIGKGPSEYPPSINLGTEKYQGTLKQYLNRIKEINASQGITWKDLGTIHTQAGDASLSQIDSKTQWGEVRMMHVILMKNGTVYIVTAAALKEEFPIFYKEIFNSLQSLRFETHSA